MHLNQRLEHELKILTGAEQTAATGVILILLYIKMIFFTYTYLFVTGMTDHPEHHRQEEKVCLFL